MNGALGLNRLRRPRSGCGFGDVGIGFRNAAFGDRGNGAIGGAPCEIFRKQVAHGGIARTAAAASEHHADQMAVAAAHRGHEVETGGAGVAGLDAIDALDVAEQAVVIADRVATIDEARGGEVAIIAREPILDRTAERRLIARGGDLFAVGQAVGIAIHRLGHAERARLARHQLGEIIYIAGNGFSDHHGGVVGRSRHQPLDGVFDLDGLARAQAELGRRLLGGELGNFQFGIELQLAGFEALEQQIERHDLGERSGITDGVGVVGGQRRAGIGIDDDRGERRAIAWFLHMVADMLAVAAGIGGVGGENDRGGDRGQAQYAYSQ